MSDFVISGIETGKLNALVKNLMKATGISDANEVVRAVNAGEYQLTPIAAAINQYLEFLEEVTFDIDQSLTKKEIDEFLRDREGQCVEDAFNQIFGKALETEVPAQIIVKKYRLPKDMKDSEIRKGWTESNNFGAYEFRALLVTQLKKQWGGKRGMFRTDGEAELFYVTSPNGKVFVVRVDWLSMYLRWGVNVWKLGKLDDDVWDAGVSVSSRN